MSGLMRGFSKLVKTRKLTQDNSSDVDTCLLQPPPRRLVNWMLPTESSIVAVPFVQLRVLRNAKTAGLALDAAS
jgi:hypothetical protein